MPTRLVGLFAFALALACLGLFVGAADLSAREVWDGILAGLGIGKGDLLARGIVIDIRLPRTLGAVLVGAALGVAGVGLSGVFRNRLADPYLLGISSGAGLGFLVGTLLGVSVSIPIAGMLAATGAGALVALLTRRWSGLAEYDNGLVLIGVAANFVFLAWTLVITFLVDSPRLPTFAYFVFGSLGTVTWESIWIAVPTVIAAIWIVSSRSRSLDLIALGDDSAQSLGVDVARVVTGVLVAAGVAVGATVAVAGVVGFVGLLAPLLARRWFGSAHRTLIPAAAAFGMVFVLISDLLIRGVVGQVEVPLGVVTAAIGGPVLVAMLVRRKPS